MMYHPVSPDTRTHMTSLQLCDQHRKKFLVTIYAAHEIFAESSRSQLLLFPSPPIHSFSVPQQNRLKKSVCYSCCAKQIQGKQIRKHLVCLVRLQQTRPPRLLHQLLPLASEVLQQIQVRYKTKMFDMVKFCNSDSKWQG